MTYLIVGSGGYRLAFTTPSCWPFPGHYPFLDSNSPGTSPCLLAAEP